MALDPQAIEELLRIIRDDVHEIKSTLNGGDGLVAKVKVLEDVRASNTRHLTLIWGSIVTLTASVLRIIFK